MYWDYQLRLSYRTARWWYSHGSALSACQCGKNRSPFPQLLSCVNVATFVVIASSNHVTGIQQHKSHVQQHSCMMSDVCIIKSSHDPTSPALPFDVKFIRFVTVKSIFMTVDMCGDTPRLCHLTARSLVHLSSLCSSRSSRPRLISLDSKVKYCSSWP